MNRVPRFPCLPVFPVGVSRHKSFPLPSGGSEEGRTIPRDFICHLGDHYPKRHEHISLTPVLLNLQNTWGVCHRKYSPAQVYLVG